MAKYSHLIKINMEISPANNIFDAFGCTTPTISGINSSL